MEAKLRGKKAHHFYGPLVSDLKANGKRNLEWDLNDWKWDGDLFTAAPFNTLPSDYTSSRQLFPVGSQVQADTGLSNSSSSFSDEVNLQNEKGKRELEKRRRVVIIEDEELYDEAGSLNLKLGGQVYPITEEEAEGCYGKNGKKSKVAGTISSNRAVCQVDDCRADLSSAKDYHRRHKVCDMHSKATKALVRNVMQRFCQQCSRFHSLQEFDEGKRSCRRRLAGHNRRRRKTHPENTVNGSSLSDEQSSSYLLISLLRILSNIQSNSSDQTKDQDLLSHLLRNLSSLTGTVNERNIAGLLAGSQDLHTKTSFATLEKEPAHSRQKMSAPGDELIQKRTFTDFNQSGTQRIPSPSQSTIPFPVKDIIPANGGNFSGSAVGKIKLNNFDLNSAYDDSQDCMETVECFDDPTTLETGPGGCPLWLRQDFNKSSPPQTSGNSGSIATQSPSSSSGEAQSRTDRIVIKLFGKDPSEFPLVLRNQILDWLSHSPTDIESYIRPGCILLTVYLRMENSSWEDLCFDLSSSLRKLLDASTDSFWRTGWVYIRVLHHVAFVCDGQIVLNTPLPLGSNTTTRIISIKPIAVPLSERAQFSVKGFNLSRSASRLLCALEGEYLVQRKCCDVMEGEGSSVKPEEAQFLSFSCSIPDVSGRGFIEIEDDSLSSSFFPFIVAEPDVCSEICTLESALEVTGVSDDIDNAEKLEPRNLAFDFINEIGWLLHRRQLKSRLAQMDPTSALFSFERFRWIVEFSIDHDWCAVVKKLLGIIFSGMVDLGEYSSEELALGEIGLLHRAVRRNCRPMVEFLLNYCPEMYEDRSGSQEKKGQLILFRPDAVGPGKLTPLHVAASRDGSESVLDALTDDTQQVGIEAWRKARDSAGLTPYDYASLRGHYTYIHLVQRKINKKSGSGGGHVAVDIPPTLNPNSKSAKVTVFETEKTVIKAIPQLPCNLCDRKLGIGSVRSSLAIYRPAMLSMVAIAAVCVCVALLFKSSPEVLYVFQPFRWEWLKYGSS